MKKEPAKLLHCEQDHQIYCSHIKLFEIAVFCHYLIFVMLLKKMVECMWSSPVPLVHRRNEKKIVCVGTKQYERVKKLARNIIKLYYIKFFFISFVCFVSE